MLTNLLTEPCTLNFVSTCDVIRFAKYAFTAPHPYHRRQCKAKVFGTTAEAKVQVEQLSFLEDGASLHLVMNTHRSATGDLDAGGQASVSVVCRVGDERWIVVMVR